MADKNKLYAGTLYELNSESVDYKAEIQIDELSQCIVRVYGVDKDWLEKLRSNDENYAIVKLNNGEYFSVFDFYIKQATSGIKIENGEQIHKGFDLVIISSNVIMGQKGFPVGHGFSEMCMEITDGHELIGKCPYDFESGYMEMLMYKGVNIPIIADPICVNTTLGKFRFEALPKFIFSRMSLNIGISHKITFNPSEPLKVSDFHKTFNKITDFFTLLCGETIVINKLELIEGGKTQFDSFEFIGYCNFPKEKLNILDNRGIDSTSFKRISIFKLTDFPDLELALNYWFEQYDALYNAQQAYSRILLDEELKVGTINKFLAAMQMIEGYAQAYADEELQIAEFNIQKQRIISLLKDDEDKKFVDDGLGFSGISFRKVTESYFLEGIRHFKQIDKLTNKYKKFISNIVNDRNFYTHSSKRIKTKLSFNDTMNISVLCKDLYRTLVLSKMGMPEHMLYYRFGHNRITVALLNDLLDIKIKADGESTRFDSSMWHFSV